MIINYQHQQLRAASAPDDRRYRASTDAEGTLTWIKCVFKTIK